MTETTTATKPTPKTAAEASNRSKSAAAETNKPASRKRPSRAKAPADSTPTTPKAATTTSTETITAPPASNDVLSERIIAIDAELKKLDKSTKAHERGIETNSEKAKALIEERDEIPSKYYPANSEFNPEVRQNLLGGLLSKATTTVNKKMKESSEKKAAKKESSDSDDSTSFSFGRFKTFLFVVGGFILGLAFVGLVLQLSAMLGWTWVASIGWFLWIIGILGGIWIGYGQAQAVKHPKPV